MQETTDTAGSDGTVPVQWCSWHQGTAEATRPVEVIERGESAGSTLHACRECRITYRLTALPTWVAQGALFDHLGGTDADPPCGPCNRLTPCEQGAALYAALRREQEADK